MTSNGMRHHWCNDNSAKALSRRFLFTIGCICMMYTPKTAVVKNRTKNWAVLHTFNYTNIAININPIKTIVGEVYIISISSLYGEYTLNNPDTTPQSKKIKSAHPDFILQSILHFFIHTPNRYIITSQTKLNPRIKPNCPNTLSWQENKINTVKISPCICLLLKCLAIRLRNGIMKNKAV